MITVGKRVRYLRDGCLYTVRKELRPGFFLCEGPTCLDHAAPTSIEARSSDLKAVSD